MCGRFFIRLDDSEIARKIKESLKGTQSFEYATNEVFPSQKAIVLILKDDEIMSVGTVPTEFTADKVISGKDKLATPGFVNAHTHVSMTRLRW